MNKDYSVHYVSIVVPVYNEEGCLQELIDRTLNTMATAGKKFEFILIDDGSRDSSREIITRAAEQNPDVVIGCILNRNYGQHSAIMAGFSMVRGDLVITLDADLQNPPEEIPNLIAAAEKGNDVVGTIRQNRRDTLFRKVASRIVNRVARAATGVHMNDYGCMLRAYRKFVVDAMLQCNERSTFIPVLGNSFARTTCEIPVAHAARKVGDSKYSLWKLINLQFNLHIIVRRFCWPDGDSWANGGVFTLFAVMFIFTGIHMVGIGVIGEYIGRLYTDVRARPRYFVEEVIGRKNQ